MQNLTDQTSSVEISLSSVINFLTRNRLTIIGLTIFGLMLSAGYSATSQKQYEARWLMEMATLNEKGVESPITLIQRLRPPTTYSEEVRQHCGMPLQDEFRDNLDGKLKISSIKGVAELFEISVYATSPSQARACAETINAMILAHQDLLVHQKLTVNRQILSQYQKALAEEEQQLKHFGNSELGNLAYLARLNRITWLHDHIDALQREALSARSAKLLAPIAVPDKPVSPRVFFNLILGGLIGAFTGVMAALFRARSRKSA